MRPFCEEGEEEVIMINIKSSLSEDGRYELFDVTVNDCGKEFHKIVTLTNLVKCLNESSVIKEKISYVKMPEMKNLLYYEGTSDPTVFKAILTIEPKRIGYLCCSKPVYVPSPKILVAIDSKSKSAHNIKIFAMKKRGMKLYWFPLGHVQNNGYTCFGNADVIIDRVEDVERGLTSFFNSNKEGHYFSKETIKPNFTYQEMHDVLDGMEMFPEEWLVPSVESIESLKKWLGGIDV